MAGEDSTRREAGPATRISGDELALRLGVDRHRVDQLELRLAALDRKALPPPGPGARPAPPHEGS